MNVSCVGDYGDSVFVLGVLSELEGGPHRLLLKQSAMTKIKTPADLARFEAMLKPLAESQPYIAECKKVAQNDNVDWESGDFRTAGFHSPSRTLLQAHLWHLIATKNVGRGITGYKKWLTVDPSPKTKGRVLVNRTDRYRNQWFPWKQIVHHYGERILFIGTQHEAKEFILNFGKVESMQVNNLLEMAQLIEGGELFIGNQSVANAISEGLKHLAIQETYIDLPDCIYPRDNIQWVDNGVCILPDVGGSGEIKVFNSCFDVTGVVTHTTPPGQWQVDGLPPFGVFGDLIKVCRLNGIGPQDGLEAWVKTHNAIRAPEFFFGDAIRVLSKNTEDARMNAGLMPRTTKQIMGLE